MTNPWVLGGEDTHFCEVDREQTLLSKDIETSQQRICFPWGLTDVASHSCPGDGTKAADPQSPPSAVSLAGHSSQSQHFWPSEVGDTSHRSVCSPSPVAWLQMWGELNCQEWGSDTAAAVARSGDHNTLARSASGLMLRQDSGFSSSVIWNIFLKSML